MAEIDSTTEHDNTCEAVVTESRRTTPESTEEIRHLTLHIDEPAFRFMEGQTIGVLVPGPHPFGNAYHHRRYSIANARGDSGDEGVNIDILVRRCFYVDEISGEQYPGIASHYLCDARTGDRITITGPYRSPFRIPKDDTANLLMIGTGTGVAPFRAFAQHIYRQRNGWKGQVRLFYGSRSGLDLSYINSENSDLDQYFDQDTFKAFQALVDRPLSSEADGLEDALQTNAAEAWNLLQQPNTYVFLAGVDKVASAFEKVMAGAAGSGETWQAMKQKMMDENRWSELFYH